MVFVLGSFQPSLPLSQFLFCTEVWSWEVSQWLWLCNTGIFSFSGISLFYSVVLQETQSRGCSTPHANLKNVSKNSGLTVLQWGWPCPINIYHSAVWNPYPCKKPLAWFNSGNRIFPRNASQEMYLPLLKSLKNTTDPFFTVSLLHKSYQKTLFICYGFFLQLIK